MKDEKYVMKDKKSVCTAIIFFLLGIIIGFFIAPMKNGVGNNNGNTTNYYTGEKDNESEEDNGSEEA